VGTGAVSEDEVELAPGAIGAFEIIVDGETKFSKLKTRRFPTDAELDGMV
jgi:selT/selW/selH-like putative selenoprotein